MQERAAAANVAAEAEARLAKISAANASAAQANSTRLTANAASQRATSRYDPLTNTYIYAEAAAHEKLAESHTKVASSTQSLSQHVNKARGETEQFTESQKKLHSAIRGVSGGLGTLWLSYGKYATYVAGAYAATRVVANTLTKGAELSYDTQFAAALDSSAKTLADVKDLKGSILEKLPAVVKDLPFSTNEAAKALRDMAQAGVQAEQGLRLLPTAAKAAIMGETDISDAAKGIIATMETFGLKSENVEVFSKNFEHVGDVAALVASKTSASFTDVIASIKNTTGVANLYKVKLEEVAATVEALGKAGIKGGAAGTFTRNMISNLYQPASKAAQGIKDSLGVSAYDDAGKMKDYVTVVNELFLALSKLNEKDLGKAFEKLFNERSTRPAGELLDSFKGLVEQVNALKNSEGTLDGFVSKLEGLAKIEWQTALSRGSDLLAQSFKGAEDAVVELARAFSAFVTDPDVIRGLSNIIRLLGGMATQALKVADGLAQIAKNPLNALNIPGPLRVLLGASFGGGEEKTADKGSQTSSGKIRGGFSDQLAKAYEGTDLGLPYERPTRVTGTGKLPETPKTPKGAGAGAARAAAKDARKILEDNLSSALKQEQTQLAREQLDIEIELAAQQLNSIQATEKKNAATKASLEVERLWIQASLDDAKATGDKVTISKFENDLLENSGKLRKQAQQTLLDDTKARTANRVSIEDTNVALARSLEDMRAEQKELGLTASQVRLLRIERERARAERDLQIKFDRNEITPEQFDAQKNANNMQAEEKRNQEDYQRSFVSGWDKAYKDYQDSATNAAQNAATAFNSVMKGMEDALTDFVTTGKTSFSDLVNSILTDLARLVVRQSVTGPLSQALGSVVSGMFGGTGGGATPATTWVAKGGVFTSPSLSAYSNGVYDSPRTFAFAQGGVFAEAGPEAIMPLTRTSSGDLGVRSQSSAPVININVKNEAGADGYSATATARNNDGKIDIDVLVTRAIRNDMKKNGPITQGLLGLTGTRRSAA